MSSSSHSRTGSILALITPGYADNVSLAAEYSSLLAVRDFNARSSPYPGVSVPDRCDVELTIQYRATPNQTYMELAGIFESDVLLRPPDRRPTVILGGVRSTDSVVLGLLGAVSGPSNSTEIMVNMSPVSSANLNSRLDEIPYFARTIPSVAADAEVLCLYLASIGVRHVAVMYLIGNYGRSFYFALLDVAPKYNVQVHGFSFNYESTFDRAVSDLKGTPLRYVFWVVDLGFWSEVFGRLLNETNKEQYSDDYVWIFSDSFATELQGDVTSYLDPYGPWLNRSLLLSLQSSNETLDLQRREYVDAHQDPSFIELWNQSHLGDPVPQQIPKPSLFSLLTYDAVLSLGLASCMSNAVNISSFDILQSLRAGLHFTGVTGNVSFDDFNSRRPEDMTYVVHSVLFSEDAEFSLVPSVAVPFTNLSLKVLQPLVYKSGTTGAPSDLAPTNVTVEAISTGIQAFCIILTSISILFSLSCGVWTVRHRNRPAVRASQPLFLGILCFGTFLFAFSSVFLTWQQPLPDSVLDAACMANPWFLSLGLTTIFAALFAKTWRIHRLYRNAKFGRPWTH